MRQNPEVVKISNLGYVVNFVRPNGTRLLWVQDLSGRKLKSQNVDLPLVVYETEEQACVDVCQTIIPYLMAEKGVTREEIVGW